MKGESNDVATRTLKHYNLPILKYKNINLYVVKGKPASRRFPKSDMRVARYTHTHTHTEIFIYLKKKIKL